MHQFGNQYLPFHTKHCVYVSQGRDKMERYNLFGWTDPPSSLCFKLHCGEITYQQFLFLVWGSAKLIAHFLSALDCPILSHTCPSHCLVYQSRITATLLQRTFPLPHPSGIGLYRFDGMTAMKKLAFSTPCRRLLPVFLGVDFTLKVSCLEFNHSRYRWSFQGGWVSECRASPSVSNLQGNVIKN